MKIICLFLLLSLPSTNTIAQISWEHTDGPFGSYFSYIYANNEFVFIPKDDFLYRANNTFQWEKIDREVSPFMAGYKDTLFNPYHDDNLNKFRIQLSMDNGMTWISKDLPEEITNYGSFTMASHGIYWVQNGSHLVYKSTDLGETWDTIYSPLRYDLEVFDDRVYAFSLKSMWRTDHFGENWEEIILPVKTILYQYLDDFIVSDSNIIITSEDYVFHSHDNGMTWDTIEVHSSNSYDKLVLAGNSVYLDAFGTILRTNDFGFHWDTIVLREDSPSFITLCGLGDIFLGSTYNQGVFRYDELFGILLESNDGLSKGAVYDLSYGSGKIWAACGNGIFAYDVASQSWSDKMNLPLVSFQYENVHANENNWVVASGSYNSTFYLSQDNGEIWDTIHSPYYIDNIELLGNQIFIFSDYGLFRSSDKGINWDRMPGYEFDSFITFKGNYCLLGSSKIICTSDEGNTWDTIYSPMNFLQLYSFEDQLYGLILGPDDNIDLYISNDGVEWTYAGEGLPDIFYYDFFEYGNGFFFRDAENYYAFLGYDGHFVSPVEEISWSQLETTQTGSDYLFHNGLIYLGDEGMYKSTIENPYTTAVRHINHSLNVSLTISPNPADENIKISISSGPLGSGLIQILSPDGIPILSKEINTTSENTIISIKDLPVGLYYVIFKGKNTTSINSFLKLGQ